MIAKKCDRCGAFYEEKEPNAIQELANSLSEFARYKKATPRMYNDLCKECEKSFYKWWGEGSDD